MNEGLRITRLSPTLSYSNNYHAFFTDIDISEELTEVPRPPLEGSDATLGSPPQFYVKQVRDKHPEYGDLRCLEFGLTTYESRKRNPKWWDNRFDNIPLARLPDAVFNLFYADQNFALNQKIKDEHLSALLEHYGWTREQRDNDSPVRWEKLEHKYFTVYYDGV
jgi:hypothetical protein